MAENDSPEPEEEELDIELEPASPAKKGGCGWGTIIAAIIIIAAIVIIVMAYVRAQQQRTVQEAEIREQARAMELVAVGNKLMSAITQVEEGDIAAGVTQLQQASKTLQLMAQKAEANGDRDAAMLLRNRLREAQTAITEVQEQRDVLVDLLTTKLTSLGNLISGGRAQPPKPEEPAEPEEEAAPAPPEPAPQPEAVQPSGPEQPTEAAPAPAAPVMPPARPPPPPGVPPPGAPPPPPPG